MILTQKWVLQFEKFHTYNFHANMYWNDSIGSLTKSRQNIQYIEQCSNDFK